MSIFDSFFGSSNGETVIFKDQNQGGEDMLNLTPQFGSPSGGGLAGLGSTLGMGGGPMGMIGGAAIGGAVEALKPPPSGPAISGSDAYDKKKININTPVSVNFGELVKGFESGPAELGGTGFWDDGADRVRIADIQNTGEITKLTIIGFVAFLGIFAYRKFA